MDLPTLGRIARGCNTDDGYESLDELSLFHLWDSSATLFFTLGIAWLLVACLQFRASTSHTIA